MSSYLFQSFRVSTKRLVMVSTYYALSYLYTIIFVDTIYCKAEIYKMNIDLEACCVYKTTFPKFTKKKSTLLRIFFDITLFRK